MEDMDNIGDMDHMEDMCGCTTPTCLGQLSEWLFDKLKLIDELTGFTEVLLSDSFHTSSTLYVPH